METLQPIIGDRITFLDCSTSCANMLECVELGRRNKIADHNKHHVKKGTVIQATSSNFTVKEIGGMFYNVCIIQIHRDIIQDAKVHTPPDEINVLNF